MIDKFVISHPNPNHVIPGESRNPDSMVWFPASAGTVSGPRLSSRIHIRGRR